MSVISNNSHSGPVSDPQSMSQVKEKSTGQKIIKGLGKLADAAHRTGIVLTGVLPFSSRGIILNLALAPLLIPIRLIQSACSGSKFMDKMNKYMDRDWNAGIQDFYIDLESPKNQNLRKQVVKENFCYAVYVYMKTDSDNGVLFHRKQAIDVSKASGQQAIDASTLEGKPRGVVEAVDKELLDIGFKVDVKGNYYNTETGNIFRLVYNKNKDELIICFKGKGNESSLSITSEERGAIDSSSTFAIAADWMGGIPQATKEAIKIGEILKEKTKDTGVTPVLVGHSHGGGMAQAGALANGIKGVVFNSRPLGAGVRRYIGQSKVAKNAEQITAFSGKGDWLSGSRVVNTLAVIFERLTGIPVPRTVGTGYHLPDLPEEDMGGNHGGFDAAFQKLKEIDEPSREGHLPDLQGKGMGGNHINPDNVFNKFTKMVEDG